MKKKVFISIFLLILTCAVTISLYMTGIFAQTTSHMGDGFDNFNSGVWQKSDGWSNGNPFNCIWRAANVNFSGGKMTLGITKDSTGYAGGEYRTNDTFGYGRYQVNMKPAKNTGIVSSFFTYTGSPWDEIDIEFLGKDTTKVQFNYYTNGQGNHEYLYNLGFDAANGFHTYAFDWRAGSIAWLVDGREVHKATSNIPTHPGKIMMNLWPGKGVDSWLGAYNGATPLYAQYDYVSFDP